MDPPGRGSPQQLTSVEHRAPEDPVLGWRYWQLKPAGAALRSVTHRRIEWRPQAALRAVCLIGGHDAPAPGCACGVHAAPELAELRAGGLCVASGEPLVVGQVRLWGAVVTDAHGLRGELAYPARLWLVTPAGDPAGPATLERLGAFGVPVDAMAPEDAVGEITAAILHHQAISR